MRRADESVAGTREAPHPAVAHVGRRARGVLQAGHGSVVAAFESSLYIESAAGIACLVPPNAYRGPLNVVVPEFRSGTPELQGAAWRTDGTTLVVEGLGSFPISPSRVWTPASLRPLLPVALPQGLASVRAALAARAPRGEVLTHVLVSGLERSSPPSGASTAPGAFEAHFARAVPALSRWLEEMLSGRGASDSTPITDLLGAGSGLTPSGDDCVVGILVALHALGKRSVAASVASVVARHAPHRTTRLSAAHLDAACAGEAVEPVHRAIEAIATGIPAERSLDSLAGYGHASGFDALAGVVLAAGAVAQNPGSGVHAHRHGRSHRVHASVHRR